MKKLLLLTGLFALTCTSAFALSMPRWGMTSIDVYLPDHQNSTVVERAFQAWSQASGNKIRFRYNSTRFYEKNSPIKVEFIDEGKAPSDSVTESTRRETTGYFTTMEDGFISNARLKVYTKNSKNRVAPEQEIYKSALADVGYILGLEKTNADCKKAQSIMCVSPDNRLNDISEKDIEALQNKYVRTSKDAHKTRN